MCTLLRSFSPQQSPSLLPRRPRGRAGRCCGRRRGSTFPSTRSYTRARGEGDEASSVALFAALFACLFPACVALFKALTSLLLLVTHGATQVVYVVLACAAAGSVFLMASVDALEEKEPQAAGPAQCDTRSLVHVVRDAGVEVLLAHRDVKLLLLLPTNVTFGLATAFFPYTVTLLAKHSLGAIAVGWLYALANVVSAIAAAGFGEACRRFGASARRWVLAAGAASFGIATGTVFAAPHGTDAPAWSLNALVFLFILYGVGVAAWQGTCMAFFADAFPGEQALPAFAALKLQSGLASAIAFFALPSAPPGRAAAACLVLATLGFAAYLPAEARVQRRGSAASGERQPSSDTSAPAKEDARDTELAALLS